MKNLKVIEVEAVSKQGKAYKYLEIHGIVNGTEIIIKKVYDLTEAEKSLIELVEEV